MILLLLLFLGCDYHKVEIKTVSQERLFLQECNDKGNGMMMKFSMVNGKLYAQCSKGVR